MNAPVKDPRPLGESEALRALRQALNVAVPVESEVEVARRRREVTARIDDQIALAQAKQQGHLRRKKWLWGAFLGAAAVLLGTFVVSPPRAPDSPKRAADTESESTGRESLANAGKTQVLSLPGRTKVTVLEDARLLVIDERTSHQILRLESGTILVDVPPKGAPAPRSVQVLTPDARVEVKGTSFKVSVSEADSESLSRTRVSVERGVVLVHHADGTETLKAGQSWPNGAASKNSGAASKKGTDGTRPAKDAAQISHLSSKATRTKASGTAASGTAASSTAASGTASSSTAVSSAEISSTLARQNALLESALSSERKGQEQRALALIATLLAEHPETPLRDSALALRKRILSRAP